jgi:hypothetical protein
MKRKLTLSIDEDLIDRAKAIAREKGTSVSRLVSGYFAALEAEGKAGEDRSTSGEGDGPTESRVQRPGRDRPLPPEVVRLLGVAAEGETPPENAEEDEEGERAEAAYRRYLEEKHA